MRKIFKFEYFVALLGLLTIYSSKYSIKPASEQRYQQMLERHEKNPELVSSWEWLQSKDDEGMSALVLLIVSMASFVLITVSVFLIQLSKNCKNLPKLMLSWGFVEFF